MFLTFHVAKDEASIRNTAIEILDKRVYLCGGTMRSWLHRWPQVQRLAVCRDYNEIVAAGTLIDFFSSNFPNVGIYVRKAYRRQGIGRQIFQMLAEDTPILQVENGIIGSNEFYIKMKQQRTGEMYHVSECW